MRDGHGKHAGTLSVSPGWGGLYDMMDGDNVFLHGARSWRHSHKHHEKECIRGIPGQDPGVECITYAHSINGSYSSFMVSR